MTQQDRDYLRTLPPARREAYMQARNERHQREMEQWWQREQIEQRKRAQAARERAAMTEERFLRLALGVSEAQWQRLGPRLARIRQLKEQADLMASAPRFDANDVRMPFDEKLHGYERITMADSGSYTQWSSSRRDGVTGGVSAGSGGRAGGAAFGGGVGGRAAGGALGTDTAGGFGGGGGFAAGRSFSTPFAWRRLELEDYQPSEGERLCEELFLLLEDENADEGQIEQKTRALQRLRAEARRELDRLREELAPMLTPRQRARLILMGYLD
jgi:hypothetical protein